MPGTLARLYIFESGRQAQRFIDDLESKLNSPIKYGQIRWINKDYNINTNIRLMAKVEKKVMQKFFDIRESYYHFSIDIPVFHISLEGEFRVKEVRYLDFLVYDIEGLDRIALALSDRKDVYKHFEKALPSFSKHLPARIALNLRDPSLIEDLSSKIGGIEWIFVSNIQDPKVYQAMFRGRDLQESEIVMALSELGHVSGLVIYDRSRDIRITLGRNGSLFTPRKITAADMAKTISRTLKILLEHNLLIPSRS